MSIVRVVEGTLSRANARFMYKLFAEEKQKQK
jgi:hypothetical protein